MAQNERQAIPQKGLKLAVSDFGIQKVHTSAVNLDQDVILFFFKQKTAYDISSRDWSSDVCSSDLQNILRPTDHIDLTLTYSYLDAYYGRYVTPLGQDLTTLPYAYTPRNKGSVSGRVRLPFPGSVGEVWLGANFTYQDRVFAGFTSVDAGSDLPSYGLLGLRLDWTRVWGS